MVHFRVVQRLRVGHECDRVPGLGLDDDAVLAGPRSSRPGTGGSSSSPRRHHDASRSLPYTFQRRDPDGPLRDPNLPTLEQRAFRTRTTNLRTWNHEPADPEPLAGRPRSTNLQTSNHDPADPDPPTFRPRTTSLQTSNHQPSDLDPRPCRPRPTTLQTSAHEP